MKAICFIKAWSVCEITTMVFIQPRFELVLMRDSLSQHMTQDDIGEVLASWLWASSRETTNDRLPSVGTLIDAANQSTAFSEVMSADSEVRSCYFPPALFPPPLGAKTNAGYRICNDWMNSPPD